MRLWRVTLVVGLALLVAGVAQAYLTAVELSELQPTETRLDLPSSQVLALAVSALALLAYAFLGWSAARAGATPGRAALRGALVGALAGLGSGIAQGLFSRQFIASVSDAYGLSGAFADLAFLTFVVVSPLGGAATGAGATWLAAVVARRRA